MLNSTTSTSPHLSPRRFSTVASTSGRQTPRVQPETPTLSAISPAPETQQTLPRSEQLIAQLKNGGSVDLCLAAGQSIEPTRLLLQEILKNNGVKFLYLHHPDDLDRYRQTLILNEQQQPDRKDGPLQELFSTQGAGGVVIVNESNFSSAELETLNEIKEGHRFDGINIHPQVSVLSLITPEQLSKRSSALISRAQFMIADKSLQPSESHQPPVPSTEHSSGAQVIELHQSPDWERQLLPSITLDPQGNWQLSKGKIAELADQSTLILRNASLHDPHFIDFYHQHNSASNGPKLVLEKGYAQPVIQKFLDNKSVFNKLPTYITADHIWLLTSQNFHVTVKESYALQPSEQSSPSENLIGKLSIKPGLIHDSESKCSDKQTILHIATALEPTQWHELLCRDTPLNLSLSAAAQHSLPDKYQTYFAGSELNKIPTVDLNEHAALASAKFRYLPTLDIGFTSRKILAETQALIEKQPASSLRFIDITPDTSVAELLDNLVRTESKGDQTGFNNQFTLQKKILYQDLEQGNTVVLRGLENNPQLKAELICLISPLHYFLSNGKRINLDDLKGQLWVIEQNNQSASSAEIPSPESPNLEPPSNEEYLALLQQDYPTLTKPDLDKLLTFGKILKNCGLIPHSQIPAFNFNRLNTLIKLAYPKLVQTEKTDRSQDPAQPHQQISAMDSSMATEQLAEHLPELLKGALLTDYSQQQACYAYLKIQLKKLFIQDKNLGLDVTRFIRIAKDCLHVNHIKAQCWQLANTFSPALLNSTNLGYSHQDPAAIENITENICKIIVSHPTLNKNKDLTALIKNLVLKYKPDPKFSGLAIITKKAQSEPAEKLISQCVAALTSHAGLSLVGPPGAGKSYLIDKLMDKVKGKAFRVDMGQESSADFYKPVLDWAKHPTKADEQPCLIIDEANLAKPEYFNFLNELFAKSNTEKTCLIDGVRFPLTDQHKIIITGNDNAFSGRQIHSLFKEQFVSIKFKSFKPEFLKSMAKSLLEKTNLTDRHDAILNTLVTLHHQLQTTYPSYGFSPRNLEQCILKLAPDLANSSQTPESIQSSVANSFYQTYGDVLSPAEKSALYTFLTVKYQLNNANKDRITLDDGLIYTPSTQDLAQKINDFLSIRAFKINNDLVDLGQRGLLIEGPSGRGKDKISQKLLESHKTPHTIINASFDIASLKDKFSTAMKTGQVVIFSEANLLASNILEALLNDVLSGSHLQKTDPGFAMIITMNPSDYQGRSSLSPALLNRFLQIKIDAYSEEEINLITEGLCGGYAGWQELANKHIKLTRVLTEKGISILPTIRQLQACASRIINEGARSLEKIFQEEYAYHIQIKTTVANSTSKQQESDPLNNFMQLIWKNPATLPEVKTAVLFTDYLYQIKENVFYLNKNLFNETTPETTYKLLLDFAENPANYLQRPSPKQEPSPSTIDTKIKHDEPESSQRQKSNLALSEFYKKITLKIFSIKSITTDSPDLDSGVTSDLPGKKTLGKIEWPDQHEANDKIVGLFDHKYAIYSNDKIFSQAVDSHKSQVNRINPAETYAKPAEVALSFEKKPENIYFLPIPNCAIPISLKINGQYKNQLLRQNGTGSWYVDLSAFKNVTTLSYQLALNAVKLTPPNKDEIVDIKPLNLTQHPDLENLTLGLNGKDQSEIVSSLLTHFHQNYKYAKEAVHSYTTDMNSRQRAEHFLSIKKGKCVEFSTTLALILKGHFQIPVRLVTGHKIDPNGNISALGHAWLEYFNQKQWVQVEAVPNTDTTDTSTSRVDNPKKISQEFEMFMRQEPVFLNISGDDLRNIPELVCKNQTIAFDYTQTPTGKLDISRLISGKSNFFQQSATVKTSTFKKILLSQEFKKIQQKYFYHFLETTDILLDNKIEILLEKPDSLGKVTCVDDILEFYYSPAEKISLSCQNQVKNLDSTRLLKSNPELINASQKIWDLVPENENVNLSKNFFTAIFDQKDKVTIEEKIAGLDEIEKIFLSMNHNPEQQSRFALRLFQYISYNLQSSLIIKPYQAIYSNELNSAATLKKNDLYGFILNAVLGGLTPNEAEKFDDNATNFGKVPTSESERKLVNNFSKLAKKLSNLIEKKLLPEHLRIIQKNC